MLMESKEATAIGKEATAAKVTWHSWEHDVDWRQHPQLMDPVKEQGIAPPLRILHSGQPYAVLQYFTEWWFLERNRLKTQDAAIEAWLRMESCRDKVC